MYKRFLKSMVLTSFAVLVAIPASAQVRADLGPLHIRIANQAPPRPQYERRTPRPHRDAVWIRGYWHWQDDRWAWMSGRWEIINKEKAIMLAVVSSPASSVMRAASRVTTLVRSSGPRPLSVSRHSAISIALPTVRPSGASMSVRNASVRTPARLRWYVATAGVGREVELRLRRGQGPERALRVSLAEVPAAEAARAEARQILGE